MPSAQYFFGYEGITALEFPSGQTLMELFIA
jgi:hypothetical protein